MGEKTGIEWCDMTFNPWIGCTKVSPGCNLCYAEVLSKRFAPGTWGVTAPRKQFGPKHWNEPLAWNRKALKASIEMMVKGKHPGIFYARPRVFCASMADVFDNHPDCVSPREHLWELIRKTPRLDWLILTKRIGNAASMLPEDWGDGYPNVWLGASIVNQEEADRDIPKLLRTPALTRFLSCEPLLERIDLLPFARGNCLTCGGAGELAASGPTTTFPEDDDGLERCAACMGSGTDEDNMGLDWVIVGGESGKGARRMDESWARDILTACRTNLNHKPAFFMKQGSAANWAHYKQFDTFPADLQVREWPGGVITEG
jgi:protein gp37